MKKQKTILLILVLVLTVIVAAPAFLLFSGSRETETAPESDGTLKETDPSGILSVLVSNADGSYTVSQKDGVCSLEHFQDVPLNETALGELLHYAATLRSRQQLSGSKPLSEYGLDAPAASAEVTLDDGSSYAFSFGSDVPGQDTAPLCYLLYEDTVYTTFSLYAQPFFAGEESFVDHQVTPVSKSSSDASVTAETMLSVTEVSLKNGEGREFTISHSGSQDVLGNKMQQYSILINGSSYSFTADAVGTDFLNSFFGMTADEIVCAHPSEDDLSEAGLDDPEFLADVAWQNAAGGTGNFSIAISKDEKGGVYAFRKDADLVWHVPEVPLFCLAEPEQLVSTYLLMPRLDSLSGVKVEADGQTSRFEIDAAAEQVTCGAKTIPLSDFRGVYAQMIQMKADSVLFSPENKEDLAAAGRIVYEGTDQTVLAIELYQLTPRKMLAVVGDIQYELSATVWEQLKAAVQALQ